MDLRYIEREYKKTEPNHDFQYSVMNWVYPYYGIKSKMNERPDFSDDLCHFMKWENKHWTVETMNDYEWLEFWLNMKDMSERYPWVLFYVHDCGPEGDDSFYMVQAGQCLDIGIGMTEIIKQYERDYNGEGMEKIVRLEEKE